MDIDWENLTDEELDEIHEGWTFEKDVRVRLNPNPRPTYFVIDYQPRPEWIEHTDRVEAEVQRRKAKLN